jgi:endonuclease/exonuclease/phosphatase family metal-dependent hydrolase
MKVKVGTQNLRILTAKESINPFSERFWIKRMKRIAANIKSVDLDLIAVQESIGRLQMYVLRYYLGWRKYRFISVRQGLTPSRVGIMYKRKYKRIEKENFLLSKAESFKKHERRGVRGKFEVGNRHIDLASVHLSHYSEESYNEGLTNLKLMITGTPSVWIAGDFNKENVTFWYYLAHDEAIDKTYISFIDNYKGQKIDYIFTPQWIERTPTKTLGDNLASDHLLVYSEILKLKK